MQTRPRWRVGPSIPGGGCRHPSTHVSNVTPAAPLAADNEDIVTQAPACPIVRSPGGQANGQRAATVYQSAYHHPLDSVSAHGRGVDDSEDEVMDASVPPP